MKYKYSFYGKDEMEQEFEIKVEDPGDWSLKHKLEELSELHDAECAEYPDEQDVWIQSERDEKPRKFIITAEMSRDYWADEVDE